MNDPFIVGEVSKNWEGGHALVPTGLLCQQFEDMINTNWARGYVLHSFQVHRLFSDDGKSMNETLIAVFALRPHAPAPVHPRP